MLSGASLTFAFSPFNAWPVTFLALTVAIRQLYRRQSNGFSTGWWFGLGWFGAGISWVHVSIANFGGMPLPASVGIMLVLCSYLALFPALAFFLTKRFFTPAMWPMVLPGLWFLAEWLRSWVLSGFPWLSLGYSQLNSPLSGWLPVIGETGVTALVVLLCTATAIWSLSKKYVPLLLLVAVTGTSGFVLNQHRWVTTTDTHSVAMVQGNIEQSIRWEPEQDGPTMALYRKMTQPLWGNDIVIWPEAAVPKLEYLANAYLQDLDKQAAQTHTALITGIVDYNFETKNSWNSMIVLGAKEPGNNGHYRYGGTNRYAKHHLLPVGEVVPFESILRPLAPLFDLPMSSFSRGAFVQENIVANGVSMAPALCFEIAFPRQVSANLHQDTGIIITVSNDAWFGDSHGPAQHLQIAQVRAKEFGRPVVRATNNGITAFIDDAGNITGRLPQFQRGSITSDVDATTGFTPYRYLSDWPMSVILFISGITGWFIQRRYSQNTSPRKQ
ncbi:apolipoprotein N-acyltransferase [Salinimonas chungwhensis]|uniref:apolipoprotein N-acyltransferase n=1 Tax=Salinimonas chungwhensis TaxID=265425 RepID=UPI00037BE4C9|nr:apolipoprotein N-acyltransferase [Salinimonas chungwhensis]